MPEMVDFKIDPEKKPWAATGWKPGDDPAKRAQINSIYINTEDLAIHNDELQKVYREIEANECMSEEYKTEDAEFVITAFGTVARIAKSAVDELREQGIKVGLFRPITVWPFPYKALAECAGHETSRPCSMSSATKARCLRMSSLHSTAQSPPISSVTAAARCLPPQRSSLRSSQ